MCVCVKNYKQVFEFSILLKIKLVKYVFCVHYSMVLFIMSIFSYKSLQYLILISNIS